MPVRVPYHAGVPGGHHGGMAAPGGHHAAAALHAPAPERVGSGSGWQGCLGTRSYHVERGVDGCVFDVALGPLVPMMQWRAFRPSKAWAGFWVTLVVAEGGRERRGPGLCVAMVRQRLSKAPGQLTWRLHT